MDVTCERCGTEYEFDETLVGEQGTSVKCTNCGHVFRVHRPARAAAPDGVNWTILRTDGRTHRLASLGDLQDLITRGELGAEDQISRSGEAWKRLGDIAELSVFFLAASATRAAGDAATASPSPFQQSPSTPPPEHAARISTGPQQRVSRAPTSPSAYRPSRPPGATSSTAATEFDGPRPSEKKPESTAPFAVERGADSARVPSSETTAEAPTTPDAPVARDTPPGPKASVQLRGLDAPPAASGGEAPTKLFLDDEDQADWPRPQQKTSSKLPWVLTLLALGVAAGAVAMSWDALAPRLGLGVDPHAFDALLERGDLALRRDEPAGYKDALAAFADVLGSDPRQPRALASAALTEALWAQHIAFEAADLTLRAPDDASLSAAAEQRRSAAMNHARQAKAFAERLLAAAPTQVRGLVALADAERLLENVDRAETTLQSAKRLEAVPSSDVLRASALLSAAREGGDMSAARADAERAVEAESTSIRARLVLARAHIARKDVSAAREQLAAIEVLAPRHEGARWLSEALDRGLAPAPPVVAVPDAAVPDAGQAADAAVAPAPDAVAPVAPSASTPVPAAAASKAGPKDYNALVRLGDASLDRGSVREARTYYLAAFDARPSGPEALTGLGYVALEEGDAREALRRFEPAANLGYADALIGLGDAHRKLGQASAALAAYRRYLERLPDGSNASIARRQIASLEAALGPSEPAAPPPPPVAPETSNPYDEPSPPPPSEPAPPPTPSEPAPKEPPPEEPSEGPPSTL